MSLPKVHPWTQLSSVDSKETFFQLLDPGLVFMYYIRVWAHAPQSYLKPFPSELQGLCLVASILVTGRHC